MYRVIARSAELRIFLEERGELRSSQAWLALNSPAPTWLQGVQRLLKQIVGKQAITPAPSEAARFPRVPLRAEWPHRWCVAVN